LRHPCNSVLIHERAFGHTDSSARRNNDNHNLKGSTMHQKFLGLALVCAAVTGCAAFPGNNLPQVGSDALLVSPAKKTRVFSRWSVESQSSTLNEQVKIAQAALSKKAFDDALSNSGCCQIVEGPAEADLVVDGRAFNESNPAAMIPAFITGLSLYTIPSWVTARVHISAEAKRGLAARSYELQDSMTMVQWLPMIFAMPFSDNPIKAEKQMAENTYNTLVLKMKDDGLLN